MKVLHIINSLATGGAEKLILDTLPLLNRNEIQADVLLLNGEKHPFYYEMEQKKCCKIFSLGKLSVYNPIHIFKIVPFLKAYDIIHVHLFPSIYWVAIAYQLNNSQSKLIFTEHSTNNRRINNLIFKLPEKLIYHQFQKIICITNEVKEVLINHISKIKSKLLVIENGVNLEIIKNANKINLQSIDNDYNESTKYLIQVSGFKKPKDQATLIRALSYLPSSVKLFLAGEGITKLSCEKLVKDLDLKKRVFFLGNRSDIPSLLKTVDISILSTNYEGFGLVAVEGMASGKPFIASDVPGLREIVYGAGVLFPKGDEKQLAAEISKLLENPTHYQNVVNKCLERSTNYDISFMIEKTIKLYNEVIND